MPFLRDFFGFILPGFAAGWIFSGGILRFSGDPVEAGIVFSAAALAGALTGRWLIRNRALLGSGVLLLIAAAALPLLRSTLFPLTAFAFGVLAVRPLHSKERRCFQTGVLPAVLAAFLFGGTVLLDPFFLRGITLTLLPAAAMLTADALPEHRRSAVLLTVAAGLVIALLPGWQYTFPERYSAAGTLTRYQPEGKSLLLRTEAGEYRFPRDLSRHLPDMLTAALQPEKEQIRVLVATDVPSHAAKRLMQFPWVLQTDTLQFSGCPGETAGFSSVSSLQKSRHRPYDLIFIQEFPSGSAAANRLLLRTAAERFLDPSGVIIFPGIGKPALPDWQSGDLPGSRKHFRMAARRGIPLADTFENLEERLHNRSANQGSILPSGILQDLYELRPPEPVTERPQPSFRTRFLHAVRLQNIPSPALSMVLTGVLLTVTFWLSRYPVRGDNFAVFAHGAGVMLALTVLLTAANRYQLLVAHPLPVLFGLLARAMPHRREPVRWPGRTAALLTAVSGCCLLFLPQLPSYLIAPLLLLLAPAFVLGSGGCGTDSAKHLHFSGLPFGLLLAMLLPPEIALPTALFLLWF